MRVQIPSQDLPEDDACCNGDSRDDDCDDRTDNQCSPRRRGAENLAEELIRRNQAACPIGQFYPGRFDVVQNSLAQGSFFL